MDCRHSIAFILVVLMLIWPHAICASDNPQNNVIGTSCAFIGSPQRHGDKHHD